MCEHYERYLKFISREDLPERYGGLNKEWPLPSAREKFLASMRKGDHEGNNKSEEKKDGEK